MFAGLAGPNLANWGKGLLANHLFAGSFLFMIGTGLLAAIILLFLPLLKIGFVKLRKAKAAER